MSNDVIIQVEGLWKRYGLPLLPAVRGLVNRLKKNRRSISNNGGPWALRDVSFKVKRGETLGIIGRNGAGKSTLLKILAGVTPPTRGQIEVRGRVFPMIELNAGLHMELTGRENVRLLGAVMGLSRRNIEAKMPEIEEFCELGEWFDKPVRKYSSGMLARLGFGVAMNVDADILLVDEVLAVGDMAFQRNCFDRFAKLRNSGATVAFVSHSVRQVQRICDRVLFLDAGAVLAQGENEEVLHAYSKFTSKATNDSLRSLPKENASVESSGEFEVRKIELFDERGQRRESFETFESVRIRVSYEAFAKIDRPIFAVSINTSDLILVSGTALQCSETITVGSGSFEVILSSTSFLRGVYFIDLRIKANNGRGIYLGRNLASFCVEYTPEVGGDVGVVHTDMALSLRYR